MSGRELDVMVNEELVGHLSERRELDRMLAAIIVQADKLIADIGKKSDADVAASPDPDAARLHLAGEGRMLRAVRHIVLADMCRQLSQ